MRFSSKILILIAHIIAYTIFDDDSLRFHTQ